MNLLMGVVAAGAVALYGGSAIAGVNCAGPLKSGDRWSYVCSEDGAASSDLLCKYSFKLQLEGGGEGIGSAQVTIPRKAKNVTAWSEERFNGKKITSASLASGRCDGK